MDFFFYINCEKCTENKKCEELFYSLMAKTVKARIHHGADSLDITIPVEIVREHDINEGDIFKIKVNEKDENLVLSYERVYKSEEK